MAKDDFTCGSLDIAIIGMSGRFSGAESVPEWWDKLLAGEEFTQPTCTEDDNGNPWIRLRNIITAPYDFDAAFFNIPPGEALLMDPQQRIFLECCYNALEHAGYIPTQLKRVGVYGATYANNYFIDRVYPYLKMSGDHHYLQAQIGNEKDYLCAQVAYKLGFTGPAVSVQTACPCECTDRLFQFVGGSIFSMRGVIDFSSRCCVGRWGHLGFFTGARLQSAR